MRFEWDERKRRLNIRKHGIDFRDVPEIFLNERLSAPDLRQEYGETREISVGLVGGQVCVVVHVRRGEAIRIISARKANARERRRFHEALEKAADEEDRRDQS